MFIDLPMALQKIIIHFINIFQILLFISIEPANNSICIIYSTAISCLWWLVMVIGLARVLVCDQSHDCESVQGSQTSMSRSSPARASTVSTDDIVSWGTNRSTQFREVVALLVPLIHIYRNNFTYQFLLVFHPWNVIFRIIPPITI